MKDEKIKKSHTIDIEVEVRKNPRYFTSAKPCFSHRIPHKVITELLGNPDKNFDGKYFWWLNVNGQEIYVEKEEPIEGESERVIVWAQEKSLAYDYFGMIVYSAFGKVDVRRDE